MRWRPRAGEAYWCTTRLADDRSEVEQAGSREVDQRFAGSWRRLPPPPAAGRSDAPPTHRVECQAATAGPGSNDARTAHRPAPIVTHVHGAVGVADDSDGYTEARTSPAAGNIPADYATVGTWFDFFAAKAGNSYGVTWEPGSAIFQHPNKNRASTIRTRPHAGHDAVERLCRPGRLLPHSGGPAGDDEVVDSSTGATAVLPGPAPRENDKFPPNKTYYEIPIAIQDRSFNTDGSLFYPATRAFFDEIAGPQRRTPTFHRSGTRSSSAT